MDISEKLEKILFRKPTYVEDSEFFQFAHYEIGDRELIIVDRFDGTWIYSMKQLDEEYVYYTQFSASSSEVYDVYNELLGNAVFNEME